jgi:predicted PhzF superfamily epimerase YddE/YHI9
VRTYDRAVAELHVLRVFTDERGAWGNPLGVFLEGRSFSHAERQRTAAELGFSETVFVEDRARGRIRIHTPEIELPFAGHPTVGTAWLLAAEGAPVDELRPPAGVLRVRLEGALAFVAGPPEWSPPFEYRHLDSPAAVGALDADAMGHESVYVWAWIDESAGIVRARSFAPDAGIPEDEATGSAALALCAQLGRPLEVRQGRGSLIHARPLDDGLVEVGGRVVLDERREHSVG